MNFGRYSISRQIRLSSSKASKYSNRLSLAFFKTILVVVLLAIIMLISAGFGVFMGIVDNSPSIDVDTIIPMGYATSIYDSQGNLTDTLVMAGSNREEATYEELPENLINAFVSIEDSRFWQHNGVDTKSIARAIVGVLRGSSSTGGGSTITQQLIKNNVFNGGRETSFGAKVERKLQEQFLAIQIEKTMDKKLILTNYLNTINLGNNSLGVKVAAKRYFNKDVSDLTLSECTVIAGITQNPSKLNPISGKEANAEKRKVILQYMFDQGYISKDEQEEALADNVYDRIQNVDLITKETVNTYSYFTDELTQQIIDTLKSKLGYSETQAHNLLYSGGLSVYTTQDPALQAIVDEEVNDPSNYSATRYSLEYRLSIKKASSGETMNYSDENIRSYHKDILNDSYDGLYNSEDEAKNDIELFKSSVIEEGDEVLGENLNIVLEPQVSFVLIEQSTGQVKALCGGRGAKTASLTLNRASDTLRQPGSTFKVLSAFAPAIDSCGDTIGSVYYDAPFTVGTKTFSNWYSQGFLGWSSLRDGITYSMNIVAVRCMMETVTPQLGVEYCKNFGITSLTDTDYNASTALGGLTYGVSNLQLTAAYASIANKGMYVKPVFFTKILDHNGRVLIDNTPETHRVLKDSTAFILIDAMKASMENNRKFAGSSINVRSTSTRAHLDNMTCAGKSGTTTSNNDIWFVGFTPYYTAGIWGGCDSNQKLTSQNGGTSFHKDIWKKIMTRVNEGYESKDFAIPDDIETAEICRKSGKLAIPGVCNKDPRGDATYTEYFAKGTVPTEMCDKHSSATVCSESGLRPTEYCPSTYRKIIMIVPESSERTDDSSFKAPSGYCNIHNENSVPSETVESPEESTAAVVKPSSSGSTSDAPSGPGYSTSKAAPQSPSASVSGGPGTVKPK